MRKELRCPWCGQLCPHTRTRCHDAGEEFECSDCGGRHTRKDGNPYQAYAFFPGDIARALRDDPAPAGEAHPAD